MGQEEHNQLMDRIKQEIKKKTPEEMEKLRENVTLLGFGAKLTEDIQNGISEIFQQESPKETIVTRGIIVPRPTDPEKAREFDEIGKVFEQNSKEDLTRTLERCKQEENERKEREKIEEEKRKLEEKERKARGALQGLENFRNIWKNIIVLDEETKGKIIRASNQIPVKVEIDSDGSSRLISLDLGNKIFKILDIDLKVHTEDKYRENREYSGMEKDEVKLSGMRCDDLDNWKNRKLREYVKAKQSERFHIPEMEEMQSLLKELGEEAGIEKEEHKIAMLMYLTGMLGDYWLKSVNPRSEKEDRFSLGCRFCNRYFFTYYNEDNVSLCMTACERA